MLVSTQLVWIRISYTSLWSTDKRRKGESEQIPQCCQM